MQNDRDFVDVILLYAIIAIVVHLLLLPADCQFDNARMTEIP